jgi:predicted DNA-binding ribbon-helix-helix protein
MNRSVRNIEIAGRRTSFRLEDTFWEGMRRCARDKQISVDEVINQAVMLHRRGGASMTSAVRVFLITYFQQLADEKALSGNR